MRLSTRGRFAIAAMIDLADALYNYTGTVPSLIGAKVAYAKSIDASFDYLERLISKDNTVIVTDENVFSKNKRKFKGWKTIILIR